MTGSTIQRSRATVLVGSCLGVAGTVLLALIYVSFINRVSAQSKVFGLRTADVILLALPPAQIALIIGGSVAALMSGRYWFALKWWLVVLACCVAADCLLWACFDIADCLVVC